MAAATVPFLLPLPSEHASSLQLLIYEEEKAQLRGREAAASERRKRKEREEEDEGRGSGRRGEWKLASTRGAEGKPTVTSRRK
ncbi:hypothetical protein LINGRAHAP2_LOCUS29134 [Linum grandiflorum]